MSGGLYRSANATPDGAVPPTDEATFISAEPLNQPAVEATAPPTEQVAETSAAANSAVMAAGSLVSRGTGFLRNLMIGAALGGGLVGNAYTTAQFLPSQVYEFLLGGVLTSVLIPVLVRRRRADADGGDAYAQRLLTLAVIALGIAALLTVAGAELITALYASGQSAGYTDLVNKLSYLMLPMLFFTGVSALIAAVLNTRGHFAAPMWAPILNNLVVIGTCAIYIATFGTDLLKPEEMGMARILVIGGGTLLGVAVQAVGLLPALRKVGFRWKWRFDFRELGLRELAKLGAWMFCYVAANQLGLFVIVNLLTRAAGDDKAGIMIYNNVFLLIMMAHGIVAVSIITALMPRMSAAAADGRFGDITADLSRGIRTVSAVLAPIAVVYAVLSGPLSVMVFRYGAFTSESAQLTSTVLLVGALGLVPFAISQLLTFGFYALQDTRTPALVIIGVVALRTLLQFVFYLVFPASFAAAGMMLGNAISYLVAVAASAMLIRRRVGRLGLGRISRTVGRVALAALGAALVGLVLVRLLPGDPAELSKPAALLQLVIGGAAIGLTYLGLAAVLKIGEITEVIGMVRRRLGR